MDSVFAQAIVCIFFSTVHQILWHKKNEALGIYLCKQKQVTDQQPYEQEIPVGP